MSFYEKQTFDSTTNATRVELVGGSGAAGGSIAFNELPNATVNITSATTINTAATVTGCGGYGTAFISYTPSGSVTAGVVTFEGWDGVQWKAFQAKRNGAFNMESTYTLTGAQQVWQAVIAGFSQIRVRLSTLMTGTGAAPFIIAAVGTENITDIAVGQTSASALNGSMNLTPLNGGGWTPFPLVGLTNTPVLIHAGAGKFGGAILMNVSSATGYLEIFDAATAGAVTLGTTLANLHIPLPVNATPANGSAMLIELANGAKVSNGIVAAWVTAPNGSTAPSQTLNGSLLGV